MKNIDIFKSYLYAYKQASEAECCGPQTTSKANEKPVDWRERVRRGVMKGLGKAKQTVGKGTDAVKGK
jgi:hypothetical protein